MNATTPPLRFLGLTGSLRRNSYSTAILRGLQAALGGDAELVIRDMQVPLYNEDEDGAATPEPVRALRQAIAASDGLVIATPEYNHGIPGVVKNAIDWASRPYGKSALIGKPVLVISSSPAFTGGVRAQAQVNEALLSAQAMLVPGAQIVIGSIAGKIQDGQLVDEASLAFILAAVARLGAISRRFGHRVDQAA